MKIELGSVVRCRVTGNQGTAVARTEWLHGCVRISIQPNAKSGDPAYPPSFTIDEPQCELISERVMDRQLEQVGGHCIEPSL